jgi:hypothetical protein
MSLSSDGGKLAFPTFLNGSLATVTRVLSTSAPAGPVDSASRIVLREPHGGWAGEDATALSPDGRTLYACSHAGSFPAHSSQTIAAYDATTGRQIRVFRTEQTTELSCGLTMDPAGGYLLYTSLTGKAAKTPIKGHPGFLTTGHTTTVTSAVNLATGRFSPLPIRIPGALYTQGVAW